MMQYITVQKKENGMYELEFNPAIDSGKQDLEGEQYVILNMGAPGIEESLGALHLLLETELIESVDALVLEGTPSLSDKDEKLLEAFCKIQRDDYEKNIIYARLQVN